MARTVKYSVKINTNSLEHGELVTQILGRSSEWIHPYMWEVSYITKESDPYIDPLVYFEDIFNKLDELKKNDIVRDDVSIWKEIWYKGECNMEFSTKQLLEFSKLGISLCITCTELD